jgi:hypothetical protein
MIEPAIKTPRKLIEVALPLDAINVASAREKSIRHGHPSTLHLWWARRPLAAARCDLCPDGQRSRVPAGRGLYLWVNKEKAGHAKGLSATHSVQRICCLSKTFSHLNHEEQIVMQTMLDHRWRLRLQAVTQRLNHLA